MRNALWDDYKTAVVQAICSDILSFLGYFQCKIQAKYNHPALWSLQFILNDLPNSSEEQVVFAQRLNLEKKKISAPALLALLSLLTTENIMSRIIVRILPWNRHDEAESMTHKKPSTSP